MNFTPEQTAELAKPLDRAAVKTREQSGRKLSYVEGWHAIAEANRIFGFDGWMRETVEIKLVAEGPRSIGKTNPQPGHGVSYIAKVRINVGGIIREGCGTGHGIDRDLGQAHESALKEAETDAMKRALMTFGNPFGLALYDKAQTEVATMPAKAPRSAPRTTAPIHPLVQQAGIICSEGAFWRFLAVANADLAAQVVRDRCGIKSRAELATDVSAQKIWRGIVADYRAWQLMPEIEASPRTQTSDRDAVDPPAGNSPQVEPAGGEEEVPTAAAYSAQWNTILNGAVPSKAAQIAKTWNDQNALRGQIAWTEEHPFSALKKRVGAVLEQLKDPVG